MLIIGKIEKNVELVLLLAYLYKTFKSFKGCLNVNKMLDINYYCITTGNTAQEVAANLTPPGVNMWNSTAYERYIRQSLRSLADKALTYYVMSAECPARCQLSTMITDMRLICGTDEKMKVAAKYSQQPVYRYVLPPLDGVLASRGMDTHAFFGSLDQEEASISSRRALQKRLRHVLDEFVKTGKLAQWGVFPGYTALLTSDNQSVTAYHAEQCTFWRENAMFPNYAWIN